MTWVMELMRLREEFREAGHHERCGVFWNYPARPHCTCGISIRAALAATPEEK